MKQPILFYILFLIIVSAFFVFFIGAYTNGTPAIIEGKGKSWKKSPLKKLGKSISNISKTIIKKLNNSLNPMKVARLMRNKKRKRRNRARNKRIKQYIYKLNAIYNYSVSAKKDYLQDTLTDFYNFYIGNHTAVYNVWVNVKPQTRTYLKEKYKRFLEIKQKIFDKINLRNKVLQPILLVSSARTFDLPAETIISNTPESSITTGGSSSVQTTDYSKNIFEQAQYVIETIRQTNTEPEAFTDFFGNSDNGQSKKNNNKISIPYYVNVYDEYADSAYFKSNDKIEFILKIYETFFDKRMYEIKHTIDGVNQAPSVENGVTVEKGQTLNYLNTKLEYFYTIINTIEQKTAYGQQLIS